MDEEEINRLIDNYLSYTEEIVEKENMTEGDGENE
jgi:hypothetical protein